MRAEHRHPVKAAADLYIAGVEGGLAPVQYAVRVVLADEVVGLVEDRVAAGTAPRLDGASQPVDHVLLDGEPVESGHGAHLLGEHVGGALIEPAGLHRLQDRGELDHQGAAQCEDRPRTMKMHTVGGHDLRTRHVVRIDHGVVPAVIKLRVVTGREKLILMLVLADLIQLMAGTQARSAGPILRMQRGENNPARRRNPRTRGARRHLLRHCCHPSPPTPHVARVFDWNQCSNQVRHERFTAGELRRYGGGERVGKMRRAGFQRVRACRSCSGCAT